MSAGAVASTQTSTPLTQMLVVGALDPSLSGPLQQCQQQGIRVLHGTDDNSILAGMDNSELLLVLPPESDQDSGIRILAESQAVHPSCWRLVLTADTSPTHLVKLVNQGGVDGILPWPCDAKTILTHLQHGLASARQRGRHLLGNDVTEATTRVDQLTAELTAVRATLQDYRSRLLELEMKQSLSYLARGLAHEFNNPLGVILGHGQRLQSISDPDIRRRADVMVAETDRCIKLVEKLRTYATPKPESPELCQLPDCAEDAVKRLQGRQLPIVPIIWTDDTPYPVQAARSGLAKVLEQIFDNARLAGAKEVRIATCIDHERVAIHLDNNGDTPDSQIIAHATKPFFTKWADKGHQGLGLSLASALLREMDGGLTLNLRPDQQAGIRCTIHLPIPTPTTTAAFANTDKTVRPRRILIIDDEPLVAELLIDILTTAHCSVDVVEDLTSAKACCKEALPDAIICDNQLPDGNGGKFLEDLIEEHPQLYRHIALVTGDPDNHSIRHSAEHLQCPIIAKPFRVTDIHEVLGQILERA